MGFRWSRRTAIGRHSPSKLANAGRGKGSQDAAHVDVPDDSLREQALARWVPACAGMTHIGPVERAIKHGRNESRRMVQAEMETDASVALLVACSSSSTCRGFFWATRIPSDIRT